MLVYIYLTRDEAELAIAAIDAARHPDGTEEVTLPDGTRERRTAKTWTFPVELEDGRWAVAAVDPDTPDVRTIELMVDENGEPVIINDRALIREIVS